MRVIPCEIAQQTESHDKSKTIKSFFYADFPKP